MKTHVEKVVSKIRDEGLIATLIAIYNHLSALFAGLVLGILDRLYSSDRREICLTIRGESIESDEIELIQQVKDSSEFSHLCIGFMSEYDEDDIVSPVNLAEIECVSLKQFHSLGFIYHVLRSEYVFIKTDFHLKWYRLLGSPGREFVRIYHGPITKAAGRTRTAELESEPDTFSFSFDINRNPITRSVESDVEHYFRSASNGRHPNRYRKYGYPRFDRLDRLVSGETNPVIPHEAKEILDANRNKTCILYAPTHKDRVYDTTFFPFPEFDSDRLHNWLEENDIRIFLRPHPSEKSLGKELANGETIYYAGPEFAPSTTEILPHFDALVTDYSSIYVEALFLDIPVIFVKDDHERFREIRGLAFDYDKYFPGPKIDEFEYFLEVLDQITEIEGLSTQQEFVKWTFASDRDTLFLESVYEI